MSVQGGEYLSKRLDAEIKRLRRNTSRLKYTTFSLRVTILSLAALSTILLGLRLDSPGYLTVSRNAALAIGALITLLTGLESFWNVREYWVRNKLLLSRLESLRDELAFRQSAKPDDEAVTHDVFIRFSAILDQRTRFWEEVLEREEGAVGVGGEKG